MCLVGYLCAPMLLFFFFFNDTATTEIYTLSLHDALPIWTCSTCAASRVKSAASTLAAMRMPFVIADSGPRRCPPPCRRSEEHTSELQSQSNLVCRLLLEKKKKIRIDMRQPTPLSRETAAG